jgi:hypothetical protein
VAAYEFRAIGVSVEMIEETRVKALDSGHLIPW